MKNILWLLLPWSLWAQADSGLEAVLKRLDRLERENQELRQELTELKKSLAPAAERQQVQEARVEEQAQTKVETSQKMPLTVTGMLLFNAFHNGKYSGTSQDPVTASTAQGPSSSGASLRQTVLGLRFNGPDLPGGGKVSGNLFMDFYAGTRDPDNQLLHLRTATVDLSWKNTTLTVGQDKPIFAPREPDSLAEVGASPLTAAGNLWDWQPQVRVEQRFHFNEYSGLRAQAGIYQTLETEANVPAAYAKSLEYARPGFQGRFEYWIGGANHRLEIAPGFQVSSTHVAGTSVPSRIASLDWLARPVKAVELTGAWFRGENVANTGALRQTFTILSLGRAIPVHAVGGWTQLALFATPRLTFHLYGGEQSNRVSDLQGAGISRNLIYAGNFMYRLAPNVITSFEASQVRTRYFSGLRLNNHYDLAIAYLF
jgi:hypothetical protein